MNWAFLRRITLTLELKVPYYSQQQQFAGLFRCGMKHIEWLLSNSPIKGYVNVQNS
jgi:hypothetical protein